MVACYTSSLLLFSPTVYFPRFSRPWWLSISVHVDSWKFLCKCLPRMPKSLYNAHTKLLHEQNTTCQSKLKEYYKQPCWTKTLHSGHHMLKTIRPYKEWIIDRREMPYARKSFDAGLAWSMTLVVRWVSDTITITQCMLFKLCILQSTFLSQSTFYPGLQPIVCVLHWRFSVWFPAK